MATFTSTDSDVSVVIDAEVLALFVAFSAARLRHPKTQNAVFLGNGIELTFSTGAVQLGLGVQDTWKYADDPSDGINTAGLG